MIYKRHQPAHPRWGFGVARAIRHTPGGGSEALARGIRHTFATALLWLGALLCLYPLLMIVADSFVSPSRGRFRRPAILIYRSVLENERLWIAFKNTAIQEAIILTTTLFFCPLAGYGFAKFNFRGKGLLFSLMILTLFFVPITQLIPLLIEMNQIGWIDTYQALVMPLLISSLGTFWMTLTIRGVPDELLHAAQLDGCGSFAVWWRIVMPAIKPTLMALAIYIFITAYGDYMWPLLILLSDDMQTIQLFLQNPTGFGSGGTSSAAIVVASLPSIIAFLLLQRYFLPELLGRRETPVPAAEDEYLPLPAAPPPVPAAIEPPDSALPDRPPSTPARAAALALAGLHPWVGKRAAVLIHSGLIVTGAVLVYINALPNSLRLDDVYRVRDNPGITQLMPIWRHFGDPYTSTWLPSNAQFRPLLPLSLSINHALTGDSLIGYRLGNLLLIAAASLLVYFLIRELLGRWAALHLAPHRVDFLAMIVALLVAIHPVSGLLINYISGRDLLLMQAFLMASLLLYARMRRLSFVPEPAGPRHSYVPMRLVYRWFGGSLARWVLVLALFELAMLAKAQAIVAPALILAFELTLGRERLSRLAPYLRTLPFALLAWGHLVYINAYLHFTALPDAPNIGPDSLWTYPLTQARLSVFHYLANFAWPFNIREVAVEPTANSLQEPGVLVGLVAIAASLIWARHLRRRNPLLAFCILGYWIAQSAESSITAMLHNAVDYRPYPGSPFLFLALALLLERYLKPALVSAVLLALILFFGAASMAMNTRW